MTSVTVELRLRVGDAVPTYVFDYDGDAGLRIETQTATDMSGTFDHDASGRLLLKEHDD